jgi:hypothetical protein
VRNLISGSLTSKPSKSASQTNPGFVEQSKLRLLVSIRIVNRIVGKVTAILLMNKIHFLTEWRSAAMASLNIRKKWGGENQKGETGTS